MRLTEHPRGSALAASLCSSVTPVLRQQRSGGGCQIGGETEPNAPNINTARGKCCEESDGARGPHSGFGVLVPSGLWGDAAHEGSCFARQHPDTVCLQLRGSRWDFGSSGGSATLAAQLPKPAAGGFKKDSERRRPAR